jgi:PPM family protein phosphatase
MMPSMFEMETAEYEFVISPSALDSGRHRPASSSVRIDFGAVSDTGKVRPKNEDHFLVSQMNRKQEILLTNVSGDHLPALPGEEGYTMIVADGMGGMAAGEVASRMVITTGLKLFQKSPKWGFKINKKEAHELFERVNHYLQEMDATLTRRSEADRHLYGMGTTLTAAYSVGSDLFIIHLGDSRAYLYRNGELRQLTRDHTVAQAMADAGYIAHEEVRYHTKKNVLTNFLGGHHGKVKADIRWLRVVDGDRLLLCSDGLTDMVEDTTIARILAENDPPAGAAQSLLDEALKCGGRDNVTVIVARYSIPSPTNPVPGEGDSEAQGSTNTTKSLEKMPPLNAGMN